MARRTLIIAISLTLFAVAGTASAGSGGGGKANRDRTPPSVAIAAPAAGSTAAGAIKALGTASDNVKLAKVEVSLDTGTFVLAQGTTSWSAVIDTTKLADGTHTIRARATDASGNAAVTTETIAVSNTVPDTTPPTVAIGAPTGGTNVAGSVAVSGSAADNGRVAGVTVSVDGGLPQPASGTSAWTAAVDTTALSDGPHAIRAQAIDAAGNAATATVSVTVKNDVAAPTVAFSNPASGASVSGALTVAGSAADDRQVAKVEVAVDGGAYAAATGTTSWSYALDASSLAAGPHTLSARATDVSGNVGTATLSFSVAGSAPLPPGVVDQIVAPEGVTIQIYSGVSGWTAQQVYALLKPNAYQLALTGPHLTVKVQTAYSTFTTTSAGTSGRVYTTFNATMYLNASSNSLLLSRPDATIAHEYGAVWSMYHLYLTEQGSWTAWLSARNLVNDPRLDSSDVWSRGEMIADDYRMLFGTQAAQDQMSYINPDVPDPRTVSGLRDFFLNVWAVP